MTINVKYIPSTYEPLWFTNSVFGIVSIWDWQTPKQIKAFKERQKLYG